MRIITNDLVHRLIEASRKRIRDRGIQWKETYREKSDDLKRRFTQTIGPGSYYRWEGHDYSTSADYFVIIGPALTKDGQKRFFAGIKRLPPIERRKKVYAPSGKYFSTIMSALGHANKMWGTEIPQGQPSYDEGTLAPINIPRHIKG